MSSCGQKKILGESPCFCWYIIHFCGPSIHWPFQEPKLEVPTIYKAYFSGLCKGISPQNIALYGTVPPF